MFSFKSLKISKTSLTYLIFLPYLLFITINSHFKYDGLFMVLYPFFASHFSYFLEQIDDQIDIHKIILYLAYSGAIFSIFEYSCKKLGYFQKIIVPYFIAISNIDSIGGFFYQPNHNALLMLLGLMLAFYYYTVSTNYKERFSYSVLMILFIYCINICAARSTIFAFIFATVYLFFFSNIKRKDIYYIVALFIVTTAFVKLIGEYNNLSKFLDKGDANEYSIQSRFVIWLATLMMWKDYPFLGVGLENFKFLNNPYQIKALEILHLPSTNIGNYVWAHSEILQVLAEIGLVGFLILTIIYINYLKNLHNSKIADTKDFIKSALIIIFIIQSSFSWELRHPVFMIIFIMIIASGKKDSLFTLHNKSKYLFLSLIAVVFLSSSIYFYKNLYPIIAYSFSKNRDFYVEKGLENGYTFWISSSFYTYDKCFSLLNAKFGVKKIPTVKEDIKFNKDISKNSELQNLLSISKNLYDLHQIWLTNLYYGIALMLADRYEESIDIAKKGLELNPNDGFLYNLWHLNNVLIIHKKSGKEIKDLLPSQAQDDKIINQLINGIGKLKELQIIQFKNEVK